MEDKINEEVYERLCAYVFGELQGAERAAFEAELAASPALMAEKEQLEASAALVREFAPAAPVELSAAARGALSSAAQSGGGAPSTLQAVPGGKSPWYMHPALQVAAAAGIAIVGFRALEGTLAPEQHAARDGRVAGYESSEHRMDKEAGTLEGFSLGYVPAEEAKGGGAGGGARSSKQVLDSQGYLGKGVTLSELQRAELRALGYVDSAPAMESLGYLGSALKKTLGAPPSPLDFRPSVPLERGASAVVKQAPVFVDPASQPTGSADWFLGPGAAQAANPTPSSVVGIGGGGGAYRGPSDSPPPAAGRVFAAGGIDASLAQADHAQEGARAELDRALGLSHTGTTTLEEVTAGLEEMAGLGGDAKGGIPPSAGFFYDDGDDGGDFKAATSNIFTTPLGAEFGVEIFRSEEPDRYNAIVANAVKTVVGQASPPAEDPSTRVPVLPDDVTPEALLQIVEGLTDEQKAAVAHEVETQIIEIRAQQEVDRIAAEAKREQERIERTYQELIQRSVRRPNEKPSAMYFRFWGDNGFEFPVQDPLSTFAADVDTASYTLARSYIQKGYLPERAQIRTEEFVNYFTPDVPAPTDGSVFNVTHELAPSLFGPKGAATNADALANLSSERWTLRVGVRGKEIPAAEREPLALTFVIDVSGSMKQEGRLKLVKHSLRLLTAELYPSDQIAIVTFSNEAKRILTMQPVSNRAAIEQALYQMQPNGGTNAEAGLMKGYEEAVLGFAEGAVNRVVFLSDGVGNIGETNEQKLLAEVKRARDKGIYLNTIGVGVGNHNDRFLEQLANGGDGICNYVDGPEEAERALVTNFTSAMQPIARDVKLQVDFDPEQVVAYRLLGYENRAIADADFRNDKVDAGELGSGHQVVALYELVLGKVDTSGERPLATTRVRYKVPHGELEEGVKANTDADKAIELEQACSWANATGTFDGASIAFQKSALAAEFAEMLRRSSHAKDDSVSLLRLKLEELDRSVDDAELTELAALVQLAQPQLEAVLRDTTPIEEAYGELVEFEWTCGVGAYRELELEDDVITARRQELRQNLRDALR